MARNEKTSRKVASKASKILRNPKSTKAQRSVAGSALTQAPDRKKIGFEIVSMLAGRVEGAIELPDAE